MNWLLFLKYENGKFEIKQAGSNIVPTEAYDKVLPTTERVARQSEKVYFDGESLQLKDGEQLLSLEELNQSLHDNEVAFDKIQPQEIYDVQ